MPSERQRYSAEEPRTNRSAAIFRAEQHRAQAQRCDARSHHEGLAVHGRGARADPRILRRRRRSAAQAAVRAASEYRSSHCSTSRRSGRGAWRARSTSACRSTWRSSHSSPTRRPGGTSATAWCRWWTCTASTSATRAAGTGTHDRFEQWTVSEGIQLAAQGGHRQARHAAQDFREHGQGLSAGRAAAPAALHPRQAAHDPVERRTRRPESHGVVAVLVEDLAHAAEGEALDFLAVGVAAVFDKAGARKGARLHRLFEHGISGAPRRCRTGTAAPAIRCSISTAAAIPI